jgi:predicted dehydrogenase
LLNEEEVLGVAKRWGYERGELDWKKVVEDPEIHVIDIAAPSVIHKDVAIAAAKPANMFFVKNPWLCPLKTPKR